MHLGRLALLRPALALLLAAAVLGGGEARAEAQGRRIVVEDFRGPTAGRVRSQLLASLQQRDDLEVVSRRELTQAARELGIRGSRYGEDDYVELARALEVVAFVDGRTARRRRRWSVTVRVRSGSDGMVLGSETWGGRTIASLSAIRRNGYARLADYFDAAAPPTGGGRRRQSQQQETQPQEQQYASAVGTDTTAETPWYAVGEEDEVPPGGEEEEDDDDPVEASSRQDALRVAFTLGTLHRSMSARATVLNRCSPDPTHPLCRDSTNSSMTLPEDRTYTSAFPGHPEAGIAFEVYPGAFGDVQEVPWFGLVGSYRHSLFLSSSGPSRDGSEILDVPTTESELYVGARGRYRFGENPGGVEGTADIGYGNFNFTLDPAALQQLHPSAVIPPMDYSYINLGIGLSYGFDPVYARVGIEAGYRLGLGVGKDAKEIWGTETTDTSGFGFGVHLHSQAPYAVDGFFWRLELQYFQFSTTFRGQTACVNPDFDGTGGCQETDPWEVWPYTGAIEDNDVTGGIPDPVTDSYIRFGIALGYALR